MQLFRTRTTGSTGETKVEEDEEGLEVGFELGFVRTAREGEDEEDTFTLGEFERVALSEVEDVILIDGVLLIILLIDLLGNLIEKVEEGFSVGAWVRVEEGR